MRSCDMLDQLLQVVVILREVSGEVIEQVLTPRPVAHHVNRVNDAAAHQPMPACSETIRRRASTLAGLERKNLCAKSRRQAETSSGSVVRITTIRCRSD
jgi:hypothetical protein